MNEKRIDLSQYSDDDVVIDLTKLLTEGNGFHQFIVINDRNIDKITIWDQPDDNFVYINRQGRNNLTQSPPPQNYKLACRRDAALTKKFICSLELLNAVDECNRNGVLYYGKPFGDEDYVQLEKTFSQPTINLNYAPISIVDLPLGRTLRIPLKYSREKYFLDVDKCSEYAVMDFYRAIHNKKPIKNKYDPEANLLTCFIKPNAILNWGVLGILRFYGDTIEKTQAFAWKNPDLLSPLLAFSKFDKASF